MDLCLYTEELQNDLHEQMMMMHNWALYYEAMCIEWNGEHQWVLSIDPITAWRCGGGYVTVHCSYCSKPLDPAFELDLLVNCDVGLMPIRDGRHLSLLELEIPVEVELEHSSTWTDCGTEYDVHVEVYPWGEEYQEPSLAVP